MRYQTQVVWPPFKGKTAKVVDTSTDTGVGLYRTMEGARRKARAMNIEACTGIVHAPDAPPRAEFRTAPVEPVDHFKACARCGQTVITRAEVPQCETCKRLEAREADHESMRLFTPAPNQVPGQLSL
jgi:hypothetical protein